MYPILDIGGNKTAVLTEDNFFEALFRTYYRYCSKNAREKVYNYSVV